MSTPIFYATWNSAVTVSFAVLAVLVIASLVYLIKERRKHAPKVKRFRVALAVLVISALMFPTLGGIQDHIIHNNFHAWVNKNYNLSLTRNQTTQLYEYSADGIQITSHGKLVQLVYEPYKGGHTVIETHTAIPSK